MRAGAAPGLVYRSRHGIGGIRGGIFVVPPDTVPSAAQSSFTATPATIDADGADEAALASTWQNAAGDPLAGKTVTYSLLDGTPDAGQSSLVWSAESVPVDTEATLTIALRNAAGVPLAFLPAAHIPVQVSGTGNTLGTVSDADEDGVVVVTFESSNAEDKTASLVCGGVTLTPDDITITSSGESVVFAMDYSSGAAPEAGWAYRRTDPSEVAITRQAGIGPSGEDGYRHTYTEVSGYFGGEFNLGWYEGFPNSAPFAYGDSVFVRFKWRLGSGSNGRFYAQDDSGALQECRTKFLIFNDQGGTPARPILNFNVEYNGGSPRVRWNMAKGGGDDPIATSYVAVDTDWHAFQMELQYSSALNVADGAYRIWLEGAAQGSPTAEATGIVLNASGDAGYVWLGAYQNNGIQEDGVHTPEHILFAITESFTAGWEV